MRRIQDVQPVDLRRACARDRPGAARRRLDDLAEREALLFRELLRVVDRAPFPHEQLLRERERNGHRAGIDATDERTTPRLVYAHHGIPRRALEFK